MLVHGFAPIVSDSARLLILGTLPGETSLLRNQYYADSSNAFWFIAHRLFAIDQGAPYERRVQSLLKHGIALWDVLQEAERDGSSDNQIVRGTEVANDFKTFFLAYPAITEVFFNGDSARKLFRRIVTPMLQGFIGPRINQMPLVSSSGGTFGYTKDQKADLWRAALLQ